MRIIRITTLALGILLFIALTTLWLRSYHTADSLHWSDTHRDHSIAVSGGRLLYLTADWPNQRVTLPLRHSSTRRTDATPWWDNIERFNMPQDRWLILRRVRGIYPYAPTLRTHPSHRLLLPPPVGRLVDTPLALRPHLRHRSISSRPALVAKASPPEARALPRVRL